MVEEAQHKIRMERIIQMTAIFYDNRNVGEIRGKEFVTVRKENHLMNMFDGFGMSIGVIDILKKNGVEKIVFVFIVGNDVQEYSCTVAQIDASDKMFTFNLTDVQKFITRADLVRVVLKKEVVVNDILVIDLETQTFGRPDGNKDVMKFFGCYSYKTKKFYMLQDKNDIRTVLNAHKYLVGFNNKQYDDLILKREGFDIKYKVTIDLMEIFKKRAGSMKINKGMLGDLLMSYSLDYITKTLDLIDDGTKLKIDFNIFKKDVWTPEEVLLIREYLERDIMLTKKLYDWCEEYFESFKEYLTEDDVRRKVYLTASTGKFSYKAICKALNWEEVYADSNKDLEESTIQGGYVSYPAGEKFENNIYCLDFACLVRGTEIKISKYCRPDKHIVHHALTKKIEKLKIGDTIENNDGKQIIDFIRTQEYDGEILEIELENGKKISCTPQHVFPVIRNKQRIDVMACNILETDDLITHKSMFGNCNPHWTNAYITQNCAVCGKPVSSYLSINVRSCSKKCTNILKRIHSTKPNLGKTKYTHEHLMKMSIERTGKRRSVKIRMNIANANRLANQNNYANGKFFYKGIYFKSMYEVKVAQAMDRDNIKWEYEPKVFKLDYKDVYTPDFYLPEIDKYLEVKGIKVLPTKSYKKFVKLLKICPNSVLIHGSQIEKLQELLKDG